ncbi:MAG TPA: sensor histidine kinase [Actinomycetota bacterium]|nr:sensor histidine kinase [Actinomycetota bacterium]
MNARPLDDDRSAPPPAPPGPIGRFAVPALVAAIEVAGTALAARNQPDADPLDLLAVGLLLAGAAGLVVRDRYPAAAYGVAFATTLVYDSSGYPGGPIYLALLVALFEAVLRGRRLVAWTGLLAGFLAFPWLPYVLGNEARPDPVAVVGLAAWLLVLGGAAELLRMRRDRAADAARSAAEAERRRAGEERLRIARELHDVLAHNISLINVQAGVALHLMDERPEQARTALAAIKRASKDTLGELRSVLDILRGPGEVDPRVPAGGLARLGELVTRASAAGLAVRTRTEGTARPVPAHVDLAAYRIVQEALTNVIRHAGASEATVDVTYGDRELMLRIEDDGRGDSSGESPGTGSGIAGMRDRAAAVHGELHAGPAPDGGFRVVARLPLEAGA